jgi:putative Mg2+ transporter-C (MgtC) family protein
VDGLPQQDLWILVRVAAAMLLGGVLGIEREIGRHAAGLRTHMLVAGAAALIVSLGDIVSQHFAAEPYRELLQMDPVRLIEAVVAAVGFVGAGAILRDRSGDRVQGLTTASSLLMAAAIGIAAGLGKYALALGASLLCVVVLAVFRRLEGRFDPDKRPDVR